MALCHRGRLSGVLTPGRRLCELIVTAKLVKKNYIKEERKTYIRYIDNRFIYRGRCMEKYMYGD